MKKKTYADLKEALMRVPGQAEAQRRLGGQIDEMTESLVSEGMSLRQARFVAASIVLNGDGQGDERGDGCGK